MEGTHWDHPFQSLVLHSHHNPTLRVPESAVQMLLELWQTWGHDHCSGESRCPTHPGLRVSGDNTGSAALKPDDKGDLFKSSPQHYFPWFSTCSILANICDIQIPTAATICVTPEERQIRPMLCPPWKEVRHYTGNCSPHKHGPSLTPTRLSTGHVLLSGNGGLHFHPA